MPRTRLWYAVALCLPALLLSTTLFAAGPGLAVKESDTELLFEEGGAAVSLAAVNTTGRDLAARVEVELLDPRGRVVVRAADDALVRRGEGRVRIPVAFRYSKLDYSERRSFPWYRLRYRLTPQPSGDVRGATPSAAAGVVSLSEITPDLFELRVLSPESARAGSPFRARVRAVHPVTRRPAKGVAVEGELDWEAEGDEDDDEKRAPHKAKAVTDDDGEATLDFRVPREMEGGDFDLDIKASRNGFQETASDEVEIDRLARVLITTDKPLYQPGQTLHVRALVFDSTRRAVPAEEVTFEIKDPEGTTAFRGEATTSRFGVASADWEIPAGTRLGDYAVKVKLDEDRFDEGSGAERSVKISRYDLPNFSVGATPDRPFYLAGENAEVEVRADYLFGQPVKRGHVRVVRESERRWSFSEQKYVAEEGDKVEGELDAGGRFVARLDLSKEHAQLAGSSWERFRDLDFAAYVTDASTNRTEQRRFRLRATKEQIHLYVTPGRYAPRAGLPLALYVSTFYPDGTPAECDVTFNEVIAPTGAQPSDAAAGKAAAASGAPLLTVRTNRYGVARAVGPPPRFREGQDSNSFALRLLARDREGRTGRHVEDFWVDDDEDRPALRVHTDKTLYRAGEPVRVEVTSDAPELSVFVDASVESRVVASSAVKLRGGRASLVLPHTPGFRDEVKIAAVATHLGARRDGAYVSGTRTIFYPRDRELKLGVETGRAVYRPGEEATATLDLRDARGRRAEGALGVVVFDKAVEERARTDQEFGAGFGFGGAFYDFWYGPSNIGGVTRRDLERLDTSRPFPAGLDVVAEMLFNGYDGYSPNVFGGTDFDGDLQNLFGTLTSAHLAPLKAALAGRYERAAAYPSDEASLRRILSDERIDFDAARDPWGTPFRAAFSAERGDDVLEIRSAGADKKFDTADDFTGARLSWPYFRPVGEKLNRAVENYQRRTGRHVRDDAALDEALRSGGLAPEALRDRWGRPYEFAFAVSLTNFTINVVSGGPDRKVAPAGKSSSDDFVIWTTFSDYFDETRRAVSAALAAHARDANRFPTNEAEFVAVLRGARIDLGAQRDGWGRPYRVSFRAEQRYADRVRVESRGRYSPAQPGQPTKQRTEVKPVTQTVNFITITSGGPNGHSSSYDDFVAAEFSSVAAEQSAEDAAPLPVRHVTAISAGSGAVRGKVLDPQGAVVPGATVMASHKYAEASSDTTTDEEGEYLLRNLPSGVYTLRFEAPGFAPTVIEEVHVQSSSLTQVDVTLNPGGVMETVEVTAEHTVNATLSSAMSVEFIEELPRAVSASGLVGKPPQLSTPRLREKFQETLLWQPLLETDRQGRARLNFKLADNITTWKMSVIGSTADGELGTAEHEFRAFQPFFVEHDPPRVLTEGDEISLPVVLRNYLERAQTVSLEIKPEDWFTLDGPARKSAEVPAGDSARETFDFRASASVREGKQRITALGSDESDAIEKPVSVHPDGEEIAETAAAIFAGAGALDANLPAYAIDGSVRAELKIYPNLAAHLLEGIEGILQRPYGCGEQTVSSTYPSVMLLRRQKTLAGGSDSGELSGTLARARRYAQLGYERLLGYRDSASGGFTYWGDGDPDLALTAYALRFLMDARQVLAVDTDVIDGARAWLVKQQRPDGSWPAHGSANGREDSRRTALVTALVARVLADGLKPDASSPKAGTHSAEDKAAGASLLRALDHLSKRIEEIDEPYLIASFALAAADAGDRAGAARAASKLRALAIDEGPATYWALETNTPFHGWGLAGRIETTALVVQALSRSPRTEERGGGAAATAPPIASNDPARPASNPAAAARPTRPDAELVGRGLLFLIRNKDRYGVWLSTQATVNVLDALLGLITNETVHATDATTTRPTATPSSATPATARPSSAMSSAATPTPSNAASATPSSSNSSSKPESATPQSALTRTAAAPAEILVNGRPVLEVALPPANRLAGPVLVDLSRFLSKGANRVEIRRAPAVVQAQLVTTYYIPWANSSAAPSGAQALRRNNASALRLAVACDRERAEVSQEITCRVDAERVGHVGSGMLLAEVGLPPGADVDRASIERAMKETGRGLSRYDVLPDRLVFYLWPHAGGTRFDFKFRPRYGINALTAPSQIYDYYNPEARAVVAPTRFVIR